MSPVPEVALFFCAGDLMRELPVPERRRRRSFRVGIDGAVDHHDNLVHLRTGQLSRKAVEEGGLGDDLNEVRLQEGRFGEPGFSRLHAFTGRAHASVTAERHGKHGLDAVGSVPGIDRNHDHGVFLVSEVGQPDFSPQWLGYHSL